MRNTFFIIAAIVVVVMGYIIFSDSRSSNTEIEIRDQAATSTPEYSDTRITATDPKSGVVFMYPEHFAYPYISAAEWPPRFTNSDTPIACELDEQTIAMSGFSSRTETINNTPYCIRERSEGAAGSRYTTYEVVYKKDDDYLTMSFTVRYPQCGNYPSDEQTVCEESQRDFPLATLIDSIAPSSYLPQ